MVVFKVHVYEDPLFTDIRALPGPYNVLPFLVTHETCYPKKGTTVEVLTINMIPKDFAREIYVGLDQEPESYILIASTLSALCKTWINQCSSN